MKRIAVCAIAAVVALAGVCPAASQKRDHARYEKRYRDPTLRRMAETRDSLAAVLDSATAAIEAREREKKDRETDERKVMRVDFSGVAKPASPAAFRAPFHFPPLCQYDTGTCWCFATTSFFESEVKRLTGLEVKLSEMHTVYWEYVEKARGFIRSRGAQPFAQGSEPDNLVLIWKEYGAVPAEAYPGLPAGSDKHDHTLLADELADYLACLAEKGSWEEEGAIAVVRAILDRRLGSPPETIEWRGDAMTPRRFLDEVLRIDLDDYVAVMSTGRAPFYAKAALEVPDNWRPTDTYWNLPLDEFYGCLRDATDRGLTVAMGGDISEPGYDGFEDAAIVPTFDLPEEYIDQDSRELRFASGATTDDHSVHLVGRVSVGGKEWFLIKDSWISAWHGKHPGYYFYRGDYIRLKMLSYLVHRDALQRVAARLGEGGAAR